MKELRGICGREKNWRRSVRASLLLVSITVFFQLALPGRAGERQVVQVRLPAAAAHLQPLRPLGRTQHLQLAISLPLRNQAALTNLLRELYDPASPEYHHFLTPQQFTEQFGPSEQDYQAVIAFARANGLKVTATYPNRLLVDVNGSVADIERALHVTMQVYPHPTENRTFYAPNQEPSLDLTVPILSISGLNNYSLPKPRFIARPVAQGQVTTPNTGSGPGGAYMGNDFRSAYVPDTTLTGTGQAVGLLQFDGYTASDITNYEDQAGLPHVPLMNVLIDGATGSPSGSGGEVEVSLDIEMAISMAPGLSQVIVYMAPNGSPFEDLLNRMASDNLARQLSCSWYVPGGAAEPAADLIFEEMAAQGQSFFNASGDADAYTGLIDFPGDTPYITQVGGTTLTTTGPGGAWSSETVWNWGGGIGSGGGISTQYGIPDWQTNIDMTANQGSTTMRNTPDVALTADNVYVRADGANHNVGGTSCAAPLWAGFMALVNQQAAATGQEPVGFVNPLVDAIGSGAKYSSAFHDITTGDNTSPSSPTKFYAVAGYDLCTGWGTPNGQKLIDALANPEPLVITPTTGFTSLGGAGGPFTVTSQDFSLTNVGTNALTWTLSNTSLWLNVSLTGGTLAAGGPATNVTVSLNSVASNLVVGSYSATVWFTNLNDNVGQSRQFDLAILSPPTITSEPADQAVLEGATATFTVGATGGMPLYYQWQYNSNNLTDGGNISGSTITNLVISNVSVTNVGAYSIIVTNVVGTAVSSNALLAITPSPPVIVRQPSDQTAIVGLTATFRVATIGSTPFFYQWNFNGTNLDGATNSILTLTNIQLTQAGNYAVEVSNVLGSVLSSSATLSVYAVPVITSFTPASGPVGTNVTITGLNFSPFAGSNIVYFGAVRAEVTSASATNLEVTVPAGATYAPITETVNGLTAYADQPFMPTFLGNGQIDSSSLGPQLVLPAGSNPNKAVVADLDGDGKPDLIVLNAYSVSLYRNISTNGSLTTGSFAPPVDLQTPGSTAYGLAVADVDGDGKLDIIAVNNSDNLVSVYRNTSTPGTISSNSFAAPVNFATGAQPQRVAVADLDGDGKPDLLVANAGAGTLSILRNTSVEGSLTTNSFAPKFDIATGAGCSSVAVGDLDGDGKPDIVVGNSGNGTLSLLRNISTPGSLSTNSFAAPVDIPVSSEPIDVAIGDLDGDGKPDLTVACYLPQLVVSVYRNLSTVGSLTTNSFAPEIDFPLGGRGHTPAIADLDGDGKPDVAVVTELNSLLSLFRNVSTPGSFTNNSFAPRVDFATGYNAWGVAIGDLNGDGRPDIVFANSYDNTISIYQNMVPFGGPPVITSQPTNQTVLVGQTATFSVKASGTLPLSYQWRLNTTNIADATNAILTLANVQLTDTGSYSVVVTNSYGSITSSNALLILLTPPVITAFSPASGFMGTNVTIFGTNFSPVASSNIVYFGAVRAEVTSASATNLEVTVPAGATYAPITETVNGLTAYADQPFMPTFLGNGQIDSSSLGPQLVLPAGSNPSKVVVADLDGDGKPDLLGLNANSISLYRNISTNGSLTTGSFAPPVDLQTPGNNAYGLAVADVDGDGKLDIIVTGNNVNLVSIYRNTSTPGTISSNSFATPVNFATGAQPQRVAVADLDGDGRPDLLVANAGAGTVSILRNTGVEGSLTTNSFAPKFDIATGAGCSSVAVGDLDGDGKPDIVVGNSGNGTLSLLRNISTPGSLSTNSFAAPVDIPVSSEPIDVAIGDLDGDGKPDLTVACYLPQLVVSVYRNLSTVGSLTTNSFAPEIDFPLGGRGHTPAIADLDGDGKPDVAVVTELNSLLSLFRNVSTPGSFTNNSFAPRVDFATGYNAWGVAIGDLNGDGRPDIVFANTYDNTISIYQNVVPFGGPPVITSQPTNQTVVVGQTATFQVEASGTLPLSYQWRLNTTNIADATNAILTLANVQLTDAGSYSVVVTNSYGSITSSNALLIVLEPPTITSQPTNQTVYIGSTASFSVTATGNPSPGYQWNFNTTDLVGATNATLVLTNVQPDQAGNYAVLVANSVNSVLSSNAVLTVNPLPVLGGVPSGNSLLIFWPMSAPGFVLETSPSLAPTDWVPVPDTPVQLGGVFYLESIPMTNSGSFYRLRLLNQ